MSDDLKLRERLEEASARETGAQRALKVLEAMRGRARHAEEWPVLEILDAGLAEVRVYIAQDAARPSYQSDREAIERITVQRDDAEAKVAELRQELNKSKAMEGQLGIRVGNLLQRLKEAEERIPPSNASDMAPEPPASLKVLVERWRLLSHQRRVALRLEEGDETDFARCARELEDVLAKKKLLLTPIYNPRIAADLDAMRKRAESAERTLELIKENLP